MIETKTIPDAKQFLYDVQTKKSLTIPSFFRDRKNVLDLKIVVLVDVSGSISQETFQSFMKQIDKIKGLSMVKVLEFDTRVVAMYSYFKTPQNEVMRLAGGGGTYFEPVFKEAKKLNPDAIIILTDGDNFDDVSDPEIPTALILTEGGRHNYPWMNKIGEVPASSFKSMKQMEENKELEKDFKDDNDELADFEKEDETEDEL